MQPAVHADFQGFGLVLQQGLRGQHVFDLAGADAEGQCAQGPVRGGVAVAANDGHARLRVAQFRPDHMHDALVFVVQVVELYAELPAIRPQGVDLLLGNLIEDRQGTVGRGHVVIGGGDGAFRAAHVALGRAQAFESLGTGNFVNQLQVDI